jgi:hypothetical protein
MGYLKKYHNRNALRKALAQIAGLDPVANKLGGYMNDETLARAAIDRMNELEYQRKGQQRRAQSAMRNWRAGLPFSEKPLYPTLPKRGNR